MTKGWEDDEEKEDVEERGGILICFSDRPDIKAISWKWHKRERIHLPLLSVVEAADRVAFVL